MSGAQTALDTYSHADFVTYLQNQASAGNSTYLSIAQLDKYFDTESQTDQFIKLYLDQLNSRYQEALDTTTDSAIYGAVNALEKDNPASAFYQSVHDTAIDDSLGYFGTMLFSQDAQGPYTYQMLIDMLETSGAEVATLFTKTLSASVISHLEQHLDGLMVMANN